MVRRPLPEAPARQKLVLRTRGTGGVSKARKTTARRAFQEEEGSLRVTLRRWFGNQVGKCGRT